MIAPGELFLQRVDPDLLTDSIELTTLRRGIAPVDVQIKRYSQEAGKRGLLVYDTFAEYVKAMRPDLMDHAYIQRQIKVAQKVIDGRLKNVLVLIPTQYGKALADDTPIATPSGWRAMGDLQPGDKVFGPDGRPTRVTAVPFRGVCPTYWVHAEGGGSVRASADHLWEVCEPMSDGARSVRTTQDLAERGVSAQIPATAMLESPAAYCTEIRDAFCACVETQPRTITFEPAGECATTCISVAHPSGLFLAGKNLMVTHNSSCWSQLLPSYYLLRHGSRRVALSSYGAELAWEHSGEARDLYAQAGGQFNEGNPKGATRNWRTARSQGARGGMWATGIGGPSLGRGYHLGITDDPIDPLQVSSAAFQKRFRNWWPAKWLRGQRPNAAKVFVMQRLGLDDPVAWLLEREEDPDVAEHWHIIAFDEIKSGEPFGRWDGPRGFPKTCTVEPDPRPVGTVLAPKFRPREHVLHMQATAGPIVAGAQRQQRPMMASGDFWPLGAFADRIYDILPPDAIDGGWDWDTAYTEKEENSASAGVQSFRSAGDRKDCKIYINDVWWDWLKFPELVNHMKAVHGPHYVEAKASGKSVVQVLAGYQVPAFEVKVSGGKLARAAAAQPAPMGGRVYVRRLVWQKLLYGEGQGLLRVTAEALRDEASGGLDVNDAFVQAIWRHLDLAARRKQAIAR